MAAHRVGIRNLLIPAENEKDLADVPPKIRADMHITLADSMDAVIQAALLPPLPEDEPHDEPEAAEEADHEADLPTVASDELLPPAPLLTEIEPDADLPTPMNGLDLGTELPPARL